ncbi:MAG: gliding motility-associated C-terminal domain-containing protein [Bacteroidetes bacterium]|nr:gliding motility-associated C-terminal domain-containing protein [Bacteroidota bacterium]
MLKGLCHLDSECIFPNGDGYNETFTGKGFGFSHFTMQIFNRWGALIFTSNEVIKGMGWNVSRGRSTTRCVPVQSRY